MTQEQKIQLLSKDFIDRDAGTLVASRQSGRLGWESTIRSGGAYSEFILHPKSNEDLIRNAYRLASEMLSVMDTPSKVNVRITPDNSCTDASTVWVATRVFDDALTAHLQSSVFKLSKDLIDSIHEEGIVAYTS